MTDRATYEPRKGFTFVARACCGNAGMAAYNIDGNHGIVVCCEDHGTAWLRDGKLEPITTGPAGPQQEQRK